MKKGLLTLLTASLVFVGCQNYDDQFDDLNAQISALKSQVDGLSSLSAQVSSLSGSISGLQAGVNAAQSAATAAGASADAATAAVGDISIPEVDLSGLETSLATLAAEVDAVQASLATAATASDIATLQAELDAIEADVDELLATSNVYTKNLDITSASELDAAFALGNNINIINGDVDIDQKTGMDATKLQTVIDRIFTVTGAYNFDAQVTSATPMTFDKLASTGDLTLKVNGPVSASTLVTAGNLILDDTYIAKVTSINLDALTSVTAIGTDSANSQIVFTSATDVQLGALALYTSALTITTKKGATLDIGSLDDLDAEGKAVAMSLTVNGPNDVSISNWTSKWGSGEIDATNVKNLTVADYKGKIDVNSGVENVTITGAVTVDVDGASDLEVLDATTVLFADPDVSATLKAPVAYGSYGKESSITLSSTDLTSVTLNGYYTTVNSTGNGNLTTVDIDATLGSLVLTNNDALTSLDVTGSEINNVTFTNNDNITTAEFDHTTELTYVASKTADTDVTATITGNTEMTSLTWGADNVSVLAVTGNTKLASIDFTGLAAVSTKSTVVGKITINTNALTAVAVDKVDGLTTDTQYSINGSTDGANDDSKDIGSFTSDSGMSTLATYLAKILLQATSDSSVNFDTVTTLTIEEGAQLASGETAGLQYSGASRTYATHGGGASSNPKANWDGLVYANTKSTYESSNPTARTAQAKKLAWVYDISDYDAATDKMDIKIGGTSILQKDDGTFGALTVDSTNKNFLINRLKNGATVTRAANLGVTYEVYDGANAVMPKITLRSSSTSANNGNGERYTNAEIAALYGGNGTLNAAVTTYDKFTLTVGGLSVTATVAAAKISGAAGSKYASGAAAANLIMNAIVGAWNAKYGETAGASKTASFWSSAATGTTALTIEGLTTKEAAGSRPTGQTISLSHSIASGAASIATTGVITNTFADWVIGTDDEDLASTDNYAQGTDLIISMEETTIGALAGTATATSNVYFYPVNAAAASLTVPTALLTAKTAADAKSTTLVTNIFDADAGIYGSVAGGGTGDVRTLENSVEGVIVESGSKRAYFSRIHWLG